MPLPLKSYQSLPWKVPRTMFWKLSNQV